MSPEQAAVPLTTGAQALASSSDVQVFVTIQGHDQCTPEIMGAAQFLSDDQLCALDGDGQQSIRSALLHLLLNR